MRDLCTSISRYCSELRETHTAKWGRENCCALRCCVGDDSSPDVYTGGCPALDSQADIIGRSSWSEQCEWSCLQSLFQLPEPDVWARACVRLSRSTSVILSLMTTATNHSNELRLIPRFLPNSLSQGERKTRMISHMAFRNYPQVSLLSFLKLQNKIWTESLGQAMAGETMSWRPCDLELVSFSVIWV